ncbi:MAG: DUF2799 domain-containing protein [Paracoccaceae bacterium]
MAYANRILVPALALLVAACAAGPEAARPDACAAADRRAAGLADALAGRGPSEGLAEIAACPALAGSAAREAAEDAYLSGHDEGRARYCTPENAEALARAGERPTLACPPALERDFAAAYAAARAGRGTGEAAGPVVRPNVGIGVGVGDRGVSSGVSLGVGVLFP